MSLLNGLLFIWHQKHLSHSPTDGRGCYARWQLIIRSDTVLPIQSTHNDATVIQTHTSQPLGAICGISINGPLYHLSHSDLISNLILNHAWNDCSFYSSTSRVLSVECVRNFALGNHLWLTDLSMLADRQRKLCWFFLFFLFASLRYGDTSSQWPIRKTAWDWSAISTRCF